VRRGDAAAASRRSGAPALAEPSARTVDNCVMPAAPRLRHAVLALVLLVVGGTVAGCAHPLPPPVRPWQREHLAKRAMRFDADPVEMRFRQHMFSSREGSDLGYGQPGGGCGCN
jgi:hypothetical protein